MKIFGMSTNRSALMAKLSNDTREILEHIAKCVMYGDSLHKYKHWVHEIAGWILPAARSYIHPKKKLKPKDYVDSLFGQFGDEPYDAESNLDSIWHTLCYRREYKYPEIKLTQQMYNNFYLVCKEIQEKFPPQLAKYEPMTRQEIEKLLYEILDPRCP